jgi:hypothetical protein
MLAQWWVNYPIEAELYFANYWFVDTQSHENIFQKATRNLAESAVDQVTTWLFLNYTTTNVACHLRGPKAAGIALVNVRFALKRAPIILEKEVTVLGAV